MEHQSLAAGRHALGDAREHLVGVDAQALGGLGLGRGELVAHPAQDDAAVVHGTAHHPAPLGERIAEGAALGVGHRMVDHGAHRATGADGHGHLAGRDRVDAEVRQHAVVGADHEGRVLGQAELRRDVGRQALDVPGGGHRARELLGAHAGQRERALVPGQPLDVEQARGRGDRMVDLPLAEQPEEHVLLDADEALGAREQLGALVAQPHQLGQRRHRVDRRAGAAVDRQPVPFVADALGPGRGALVGPGDAGRERRARAVDQDQAVHGRAEGDGEHVAGRGLALLHAARDGREHGLEDLLGILLGGAGLGLQQRVADRVMGQHAPRGREGHGLGAGGSDVDADDGAAHGCFLLRPPCSAA